MRQNTLLHAITVQRLPYDGQSDKYELITGRKRLAGAIKLDWTQIKATIFPPGVSPEKVEELSLEEDLKRGNLPWFEIAEKEAQLHDLRIRQHGQRSSGKAGSDEGATKWSLKDTAAELEKSKGHVSESIKIAEVLRQNPSLRKVQDRQTALKLIRDIERRERAIEDSQLPVDFELDQILCGDSLELLKRFPSNSFDACITDPPWIEYKDASLTRDESTISVFKEIYRVMKPNSLLYAIMGFSDFYTYQIELAKFGFQVQKWPLLWVKSGTITHGRRSWEYARDYEPILLAAKGSPVLTIPTELSAVMTFPAVPSVKLTHPNEKPIELLKKIITQSTYDGAKVLDPFAGSGVTLAACKELGRKYIGIERDHHFYKGIEKRLGK
jgi:ParB-like chromosome segregation protein Spo0J